MEGARGWGRVGSEHLIRRALVLQDEDSEIDGGEGSERCERMEYPWAVHSQPLKMVYLCRVRCCWWCRP